MGKTWSRFMSNHSWISWWCFHLWAVIKSMYLCRYSSSSGQILNEDSKQVNHITDSFLFYLYNEAIFWKYSILQEIFWKYMPKIFLKYWTNSIRICTCCKFYSYSTKMSRFLVYVLSYSLGILVTKVVARRVRRAGMRFVWTNKNTSKWNLWAEAKRKIKTKAMGRPIFISTIYLFPFLSMWLLIINWSDSEHSVDPLAEYLYIRPHLIY